MPAVALQSLVLAAGGLVSPGSITVVILLLMSERGVRRGLAYSLGYLGAYTLIGVGAVAAGYQAAAGSSGFGVVSSVVFAALGTVLLWIAARNWRRRDVAAEEHPRLLSFVDRITPARALGLGAAVTVVNVKNLAIFLSAVSVALVSDLPLPSKIAIAVLDALVFCGSVVLPVLVYAAAPARARERLGRIQETLAGHGRTIRIWAPAVFGGLFLLQALKGLP
jgi:threonine/homoserine/homoserine lactone efflux protein